MLYSSLEGKKDCNGVCSNARGKYDWEGESSRMIDQDGTGLYVRLIEAFGILGS